MAFCAEVYDGNLYLQGTNPNVFFKNDGAGRVVKVTPGKSVSVLSGTDGKGSVGWLKVFDGKLFIGTGKQVHFLSYNGSSVTEEKVFDSDLQMGSMEVFNGCLFAGVTKATNAEGTGYAEIWRRMPDSEGGEWSLAIDNETMQSLGGNPGNIGLIGTTNGLDNASGWLCAKDDALYAVFSKAVNSDIGESSMIYKIIQNSFDLENVTWLDTDVSGWAVTSVLDAVTISGSNISLPFDKTDDWATYSEGGTDVNANPWIFIPQDGTWYAATFEWFKPGNYTKPTYVVAGDHIKQFSVIPEDWSPTSGVEYGFMVSSIARGGASSGVQERTNIVMFTWP
jgi:hypothetical protein